MQFIIVSQPAIIKGCDSHPLNAGLRVSLREDAHLSTVDDLGGIPQHHKGLPMAISSHTTQHPTRVGEAVVCVCVGMCGYNVK